MKLIEITVSPTGQSSVQTKGFTGGECREASKFFMSLSERLGELVRAGFSGVWVESHEHDDVVIEHDLPTRGQLDAIARGIATETDDLPEGPALQTVLDAAAGLTRYEAEGAFSLFVAQFGRITK